MNDVAPINGTLIQQRISASRPEPDTTVATLVADDRDQVEISSVARALSLLESAPDIRMDKVAQAREAIARGEYETPERIDYTVRRLLRDVLA